MVGGNAIIHTIRHWKLVITDIFPLGNMQTLATKELVNFLPPQAIGMSFEGQSIGD